MITSNGVTVQTPAVSGEAGTNEEFSIRSKVVITPDDRTKIRLSGMYLRSDSDQGAYRHPLEGAILSPNAGVNSFVHDGGFWDYNSDVAWSALGKQYMFSADAAYEADFATIKSITSYLSATAVTQLASDATPFVGTHFKVDFSYRTFTQELQLLSNSNGPSWLEYVAGLYYLNSTGTQVQHLVRGNFIEGLQDRTGVQRTESKAAYGQVTIKLSETTRLTGGLRYTSDGIEADQIFVGQNITTIPTPPAAFQFGVVSSIVTPQKQTFSKLTWRLAIDQKLSPDILLFASMSRGYKAGAYNPAGMCNVTPAPGLICTNIQSPVSPEVLDAYEIGIKSDLFDRRLRVNMSGFYYDYKNLQVNAVIGTPPINILTNAATARIYGVDLEVAASITENLTLSASASYLDAKYTSYPGAVVFTRRTASPFNNVSGVIDAAGFRLVRAPKFTSNIGVNWDIPTELGKFNLNAMSVVRTFGTTRGVN